MSHMRFMRSAAVLAVWGSLMFAVACIDFRQTNPFDPAAPITVTIFPETLFSVAGGLVQFTMVTVPPFTDPRASWSVGSTDLYATNGTGLLYSAGAPLWPQTDTVPITISIGLYYDPLLPASQAYTRTLSGSVIITQRLVRIQVRCFGAPACDALTAGASTSVLVYGFDALGSAIAGLPSPDANPLTIAPIATFIVRDTSIASAVRIGMRAATVTAKKTGATWIVAQRDSLRDSLRLVVR